MTLSSGFKLHASPEAIEAALRKASSREHEAAQEVNALMALFKQRAEEINKGLWPRPVAGNDPAKEWA